MPSTTPATKSQIAERPSGNAVTVATSNKDKAADVDRKLKFFGVIQAFRSGRFPDNKQIDEALAYTVNNSPVDVEKLSPDGQKLIEDVRAIISTARQIVAEKNNKEELQNFLHATIKSDIAGNTGIKAPVSQADAKKDAETAGEAFRTLVKLFLRNGEARKLVQDLGLVGRDVFADAASFAADKTRPDQEKLASVDQPAPEGEFHDDIPEAFRKAEKAKDKAVELKDQAANTDLQAEAQKQAQKQVDNGTVDPNATAEENKQKLANVAEEQKKKLLNAIPQQHKDLAKEHKDKTVNYLKENFPEERRNQWIARLKKVLVECQRRPEYQDAMEFFLAAAENYTSHANDLHSQAEQNAANVRGESNVATAERTFRTLLERFANGQSSQPMFDAVDKIYTDVKNDSELKAWFSKLDSFIRRCLQEDGYVLRDECNNEAQKIQQDGKRFFSAESKYRSHFEDFFKTVEVFFTAMGDDPLNKEFGQRWTALGKDLFFDESGKPAFKPHLWSDIRDPILPQLLAHVGYVPVPRIEYTDAAVDLVLENLSIDAANILPNSIDIESQHHVKLSAYKNLGDFQHHQVKLTLRQIQTDMREVHFAINKKKGFPSLKESGTADVLLGGNGLTVTVHLEVKSDKASLLGNKDVFTVKSVKAKIDKLTFAIRGTKHDLAIKILRPLASGLIKKQICKAAEQGIADGLRKANAELVSIRDAEEGKKLETLKAKTKKAEATAEDSKPKGTFKLATSKRNSILPDLGNSEGWVNKLDARAQAAEAQVAGAQDWHSPAFSIIGTPTKSNGL